MFVPNCFETFLFNRKFWTPFYKGCGLLEVPEGGEIEYSNRTDYQSVATFSCSDGYSLKGSEKRECLANGSWSRENPFCEIKSNQT